ncbi:helix-turn-helix transcriptional regulator [Deinococcus petrolearius]|uniref:Helix-turn-helix transcriptional regulator n=1 Tax=Deinococcus petrolearius TaxID=1751295 RepID=A0ABW1DHP6_9DEIO
MERHAFSSPPLDRPPTAGPDHAAAPGRSARLAALLGELQARCVSTAELARSLGVSQRSVQRDIETLRSLGHDVVEHQGRAYSVAGAPLLRPAEALAAYAAVRLAHHHAPALDGHHRHALGRMAAALPERVRHTLGPRVRSGDTPYAERQIEQVAAAWVDGRVLGFDYRCPDGRRETGNELCVYFIEISRSSLTPYVVGRERRSGEVRSYKLSRMMNLRPHGDISRPDPDFDPRAVLGGAWQAEGGAARTGTVTVRFAPEAAGQVMASGVQGRTRIGTDGSVEMDLEAALGEDGLPRGLLPLVLSWGPRAEVLAPPQMRAAWLRELRETLARYDLPQP